MSSLEWKGNYYDPFDDICCEEAHLYPELHSGETVPYDTYDAKTDSKNINGVPAVETIEEESN